MNRHMQLEHIVGRILASVVICSTATGWAATIAAPAEPNVEIASAWWPEMENTWVPIGWKDHPLRFNVLYNGTVIAQPVRYPARGQGVQLTFQLSRDGALPAETSTEPYQLRARDGGVGDQGWSDQAAPVLWTRWRQDSIILRQEVFAHMQGGGPVTTGDEPLFAWIRLSLENSPSGGAFALVRINQPHIQTEMDRHKNLLVIPAARPTRDRCDWNRPPIQPAIFCSMTPSTFVSPSCPAHRPRWTSSTSVRRVRTRI